MKNGLNKFVKGIVIFTVAIGLLAYVLWQVLPDTYFSPALPLMFPFFMLTTLFIFYVLTKDSEKTFSNFVNRFMLATFGKMMFSLIILFAYVFTHREDAVPFIIAFFILYIAYSVYKAIALLKYPYPGKK